MKRIISNHAVKLDFPNDLYLHLIFYVNFFEPAATDDPHPGHIQSPGPLIKVDGEIKYKVTAIVDSQILGRIRKLQYCIQWTGYAELNWENALNITNAADLLYNFYSHYLNKTSLLSQI